MTNLANVLQAQGDLDRARALQERALATCHKVFGGNHVDTLAALSGLAAIARDEGRLEEARATGEEVLQRKRRVLGDTHPSTLESMRDLAETLKRLGDTERALELLTRAFDLQAKWQQMHGAGS
jgi:tetratricopeptide (TPR) repeat protein